VHILGGRAVPALAVPADFKEMVQGFSFGPFGHRILHRLL
jgi:hypothetical protein